MFPSKSEIKLFHGDCLEVMQGLPDSSVDCVVTDPPYALTSGSGKGFMGKEWDGSIPGVEIWKECLRVAKPGAMLLAFGGTRTYHRLTCAIEDAGWEIRDCLMYVYGSGFPKSLSIGKAIDKAAGAEREVLGIKVRPDGSQRPNKENWMGKSKIYAQDKWTIEKMAVGGNHITKPTTSEAKTWEGYGTALKPSYEPIVLAMKPLDGTFANNALKHGVAGINIDGCRVEGKPPSVPQPKFNSKTGKIYGFKTGEGRNGEMSKAQGRFPANLILTYPEDEYILKEDLTKEQKNEIFQWLQENT